MTDTKSQPLKPCTDDIKIFMHVVFGGLVGYIPFRSFAEKGNSDSRPPANCWIEADDDFIKKAEYFANKASKGEAGCYVISGTVSAYGQAKAADVIEMQVLLIDIDDGDTENKLQTLSNVLGQPTMIVESGGVTVSGHSKLHVYWQLWHKVSGYQLEQLLELRHKIALSVGGDIHFKSAHQPIRVAGSIYYKGEERKLVKIRHYDPFKYELEELIEAAKSLPLPNISSDKSKNLGCTNHIPFETILTSKVHEGGIDGNTRFGSLQRVIGYWLRRVHDGVISREKALEEISAYNQANVIPPWPEDKLRSMIEGLWKKHITENSEARSKYKTPSITDGNSKTISAINPTNWQGNPPQRQWLIECWLPRGYVTALYGDGGVGKSLLAQQLMTALSIGQKFLGSKIAPCRVYALMCEDDENELWRRQVDINKHYNTGMDALSNVRLVSRVGDNNLLMIFSNSEVGELTEFFNKLYLDIAKYKPDLVILDTAADIFGGNENNRPQVRQFIQSACAKIARDTDGAVLLCAHPSESGIQKGTGAGGSTAWNNTVRSRWYLKRPDAGQLTEDHRILLKVKSNYSKIGTEEYLKWDYGAFTILDSKECSAPINGKKQNNRNAAERDRKTQLILQLIDYEASEGRIYTMNQFAQNFEDGDSKSYGLGSRRGINERLSIAATQGLVTFFNNPQRYGLNIRRKNYLCTDKTMFRGKVITDTETGEVITNLIKTEPTHYKCQSSGQILSIKNREKGK